MKLNRDPNVSFQGSSPVDDVFVEWNGNEQQCRQVHEYLICQRPNIQYTTKEEIDGRIAPLDVQVERYGSHIPRSLVFHKRHTGSVPQLTSNLTITQES